jgi:chromosome partitioning protein
MGPGIGGAGEGRAAVRSIAVVNLKGGSGKTTTALCLAVGFAKRKKRVLLIDADPQANATMTLLDGAAAEAPTLGDVLLDEAEAPEAIRPSRVKRVDIMPADARLADAALLLADRLGRERRLRSALDAIDAYDLVVIDAAPQMSLVSVNVLNYAAELLVPVDAGLYSIAGLARLGETVDRVRRYLDNRGLRISGLVVTRAHHNKATKDLERQLREAYGDLVYRTVIPHSVRVEEAHARHRTVLEFDPRSAPALAYDRLITEVLEHGQQPRDARRADPADDADADAA